MDLLKCKMQIQYAKYSKDAAGSSRGMKFSCSSVIEERLIHYNTSSTPLPVFIRLRDSTGTTAWSSVPLSGNPGHRLAKHSRFCSVFHSIWSHLLFSRPKKGTTAPSQTQLFSFEVCEECFYCFCGCCYGRWRYWRHGFLDSYIPRWCW